MLDGLAEAEQIPKALKSQERCTELEKSFLDMNLLQGHQS